MVCGTSDANRFCVDPVFVVTSANSCREDFEWGYECLGVVTAIHGKVIMFGCILCESGSFGSSDLHHLQYIVEGVMKGITMGDSGVDVEHVSYCLSDMMAKGVCCNENLIFFQPREERIFVI